MEGAPKTSRTWRERWTRLQAATRRAGPFAGGALAVLLGLWLYNTLFPSPQPLTQEQINDTVAQVLASTTPPPAFSEQVYQVIRPSLVLIQTDSQGKAGGAEHGLGSGVIIDDAGDILTALHVVSGATSIRLTFADGTQSEATVTATQPDNDIAVLSAQKLPTQIIPAVLGSPGAMQVGDDAYVVGNPFGLYGSMSAGVISGFDRTFKPDTGSAELKGLIQIDAAVNPGASGGPLLNRAGQVIGIIEGLANPTDQNFFVGIGFAVPINTAGGAAGLPPY
jgi:S1-C subfamily serine protease